MNEENKPNYFAIIPANVRYDKELTDKAKLLYAEITSLSNKMGYCFASNKYFADLYNCTTRSIQNAISQLQEKGYVFTEIENKDTELAIENFMNYYYKSIVNELVKEKSSPSFFIPKNEEIDRFLKINRDYFENHNYKVYFTGARYEYRSAFQNVQPNELMIAIKEEQE